ncbi:MAG: hypothetical protein HZR80_03890 [Candidatus Heimdallarchaeota archaeon]
MNGNVETNWKHSYFIFILLFIVTFSLGYNGIKPTRVIGSKAVTDSTLNSNFELSNANFSKINEYDNNFDSFDTNDLFILENRAYLAAGYEGIIIFDISEITSPKIIGQFTDGNFIVSAYAVDDLVYLAAKTSGLIVVNFSNPSNPVKVSQYDYPNVVVEIRTVVVRNNLAYCGLSIGFGASGLLVLDCNNLFNITIVYENLDDYRHAPTDIHIWGNQLFMVFLYGIYVYDITDPKSIYEIDSIKGYTQIESISLVGNIMYTCSNFYGFLIYDISNISDPILLGRYQEGIRPYDVTVEDDIAYIACRTYGLILLDVSDNMTPTRLSLNDRGGSKSSLWYLNNHVIINDGDNLLQVFDVTNSLNPINIYNQSQSGYSTAVAYSNDEIYIADGFEGLEIINTINVLHPTKIATFNEVGYNTTDVCIVNNVAFLADVLFGLVSIDISVSSSPIKIANWTDGGLPISVAGQDDVVLLVDYSDGLEIFNVSDLANPVKTFTYSIVGAKNVLIDSTTAYLAVENSGIVVLNITDIYAPTVIDAISDSGPAYELEKVGNFLYLADGTNGIEIYNVTDVFSITKIAPTGNVNFAKGVTYSDSMLYVAKGSDGVTILEVSQYTHLEIVGQFDDGEKAHSIAVYQEFIFVADGYNNLDVISKDNDNDGLVDYVENNIYNTDSNDPDSDQDGLSDLEELLMYNTNPNNSDTDSDQLPDLFELENSLNPFENDAAEDPDEDGLTNLEEYGYLTDPQDEDTDDDFLTDYEEVIDYNTDSNNPDTDGDGWSDSWEVYYETDPLDPTDYPDLETTPPFTEPPPDSPFRGSFSYYYLLAIVGGPLLITGIVYLIIKLVKKPDIV